MLLLIKMLSLYLNLISKIFIFTDDKEFSELIKISDIKEKNTRIRSIKEKITTTTEYDKEAMKVLEIILSDEINKFNRIKIEIENEIIVSNNLGVINTALSLLFHLNSVKIEFFQSVILWSKNYAKSLI